MELLLLDKDFQICGLIDDFSSLLWNRKYYKCGNFNLKFNLKFWKQFENAKFVYSNGFKETAILETLSDKTSIKSTDIEVAGRFLESLLAQRVIDTTQYFKNMITEDIIRSLVNTFAINAGERTIPKLALGNRKGLGRERSIQITGKNLLEAIYELCKEDELSIRLWYNFDSDQLIFEVWKGLNRIDLQDENTWAIFSRDFENITNDEYFTDETQYCNFAYIAGEARTFDKEDNEAATRIVETVNRIKPGEERKELYVDARDLQKDDDMTDEEYLDILKERGIEKLNEYNKVETVNFNIDPLSNLEYQKDYDLGDKAVYKNEELGFNIEKRIVEITESYEDGNKTIDVTFGEDYNIKKLKEMINR